MFGGRATAEATAHYASRFADLGWNGFFRPSQGWTVSSLGIGTYLGGIDEGADAGYTEAIGAALDGGINFIDTSLNYRIQRSEKNIGAALKTRLEAGSVSRGEFVVATKAGYLVPGAAPELEPGEIVGGMHSMAPAFLAEQLERSRENLGLETIDIFYLHNPETQLASMELDPFYERIERAFAALEEMVAAGKIQAYGAATWEGFRKRSSGEGLSLVRMAEIAWKLAGNGHHFRFIQVPFNLGMVEAYVQKAETLDAKPMSVLDSAVEMGVTVVASATLLQARLARDLPDVFEEHIPGLATDAQRAIQFTRSTPGIATALVGMGRAEHVRENLGIARHAPLELGMYQRLFQPA
ncbi:MAG: aldo/keto reductase [Acidobacteria bacterium]|nr:aldo/keto reductase [Acidobacteriota bacterium]